MKEREFWPTERWENIHPSELGCDASFFDVVEGKIRETYDSITSFLVVKKGFLISENYVHDCDSDTCDVREDSIETLHYVYSSTKSVVSAVVGVAIQQGFIKSVEQPVVDFFPELAASSIQKRDVLIRHLLTMTVNFDEGTSDPPTHVSDALKAQAPGSSFRYLDAAPKILSKIVTLASGKNCFELATSTLFAPMGIQGVQWKSDSQGDSQGAAGLMCRSRDMAKFGYLYLNGGTWDGEELLRADWIADSTRIHNQGGAPVNDSYGYLWWIGDIVNSRTYYAAGLYCQRIYVFPELDAVIVMTCNRQGIRSPMNLIKQCVKALKT